MSGIIALAVVSAPVFAEEGQDATIFFRAVNAGYKDEQSAQNFDFFEIAKSATSDIDLATYKIQYYNSSDSLAGELEFVEPTILHAGSVVFGFNKSPQYADASSRYLYSFSSAGLASTAGRLRIMRDVDIIDEICWGKNACVQPLPKFATKQEENRTAFRQPDGTFIQTEYYPLINSAAIIFPEPAPTPSCSGLKITEIYSYYEEDSSEQFIELYNSLDQEIVLDACAVRYKNKEYPLQESLQPGQYLLMQDISLAKNPASENAIELLDASGIVDVATYSHGQKKGASLSLLDGQ